MSSYTMPDGFKVSLSVSLEGDKWVAEAEGRRVTEATRQGAIDAVLCGVMSDHLPRGLSDKATEVLMTIRNTAYLDHIIRAGHKVGKAVEWSYEYIRHDLDIKVDYDIVYEIVLRYNKTV